MSVLDASLHLVETMDDAVEFVEWLGHPRDALAVDTETGGLEFWKQPLRLVQFGDLTAGWSIPWDRWSGLIIDMMKRYDRDLVFHNSKFDERFLRQNGVQVTRSKVHDTMPLSHIIDPTGLHGLKPLGARYLDSKLTAMQDNLKKGMAKNKWTWATVPFDYPDYWIYAALDTVITSGLYDTLKPQVDANPAWRDIYELEMAAQWAMSDLETRGIRVDLDYCQKKYDDITVYVEQMATYIKDTYSCGVSDRLVAARLLALGVPLSKTTDSGRWSVDKDVLEEIMFSNYAPEAVELAGDVLHRRQAQKTGSAYFRNFLEFHDGEFIHPDINLLGAQTSRMSVSRPALHQLPKGRVVRDAFIPREGNTFIDVDFDQIEQRLIAHFANEKGMIDAFREADSGGADFFTALARRIYNDPTIQKSDPRRNTTKTAAYAKAYGAGAETFAYRAGITLEQGQQFLASYAHTFPGFPAWQREVEREARESMARDGRPSILTDWGRRLIGDEDTLYALANYKIQGTASDFFKQKVVDLDNGGYMDFAVMPVHDEILFDVPLQDVDEVAPEIVKIMRETERFRVQITCEAEFGMSWGQAHG